MKLGEVVQRLEEFSPPGFAHFEKQNGLLAGDPESDVKKICVTLDFTGNALGRAMGAGCGLLIFHNSGNYENPSSKLFRSRLETASCNNIAAFQMHLNLDFCRNGIIDSLCKIMGFRAEPAKLLYAGETIVGGVYVAKTSLQLNDVINRVKRLKPRFIVICGRTREFYKNIAITSGSGCKPEFIEQLKTDAFICGQIGHEAMRTAEELGMTLVSATNYSTENEPLKLVSEKFRELLPGVKIGFIDDPDSVMLRI